MTDLVLILGIFFCVADRVVPRPRVGNAVRLDLKNEVHYDMSCIAARSPQAIC